MTAARSGFPRWVLSATLLAATALTACGDEAAETPPGTTDANADAGSDTLDETIEPPDADATGAPDADAVVDADAASPEVDAAPPGLTPAEVVEHAATMRDAMIAYLDDPSLFVAGEWQQHYGDAAMYGPAFDLHQWQATGEAMYLERATLALDQNVVRVQEASDDIGVLAAEMETVAMSVLALIEAGLFLDDADPYRVAADAFIEIVDALAVGLGDYLEITVGRFAASTYGPTAISSFVALIHLQHALVFPDASQAHHLQRAREVLDHIHAKAWDDTLGAYRYQPDDDGLYLYPNITMMLAYGRAYQLTGDALYLDRIAAAYAGIQPLKDATGDHYHSPYSAAYMGAQDEDYSTLSSQNYLLLALWLAYTGSGEVAWLEEIDTVLGWLDTALREDGRILHHWMNGQIAQPGDKEYYCSGCNLQTLYLLSLVAEG